MQIGSGHDEQRWIFEDYRDAREAYQSLRKKYANFIGIWDLYG